MNKLIYKFKDIKQCGNQLIATYEIEALPDDAVRRDEEKQIANRIFAQYLAEEGLMNELNALGISESFYSWLDRNEQRTLQKVVEVGYDETVTKEQRSKNQTDG